MLPLPAGASVRVVHSGDLAEDVAGKVAAEGKRRGVADCALLTMAKDKAALGLPEAAKKFVCIIHKASLKHGKGTGAIGGAFVPGAAKPPVPAAAP